MQDIDDAEGDGDDDINLDDLSADDTGGGGGGDMDELHYADAASVLDILLPPPDRAYFDRPCD